MEGSFIPAGSELDQQLRIELKGTERATRTERKHASAELQVLGEELLTLGGDALESLGLPEKLYDALVEARRITAFGGKRRQKQFIGKLMHTLTPQTVAEVVAAVQPKHGQAAENVRLLHRVERWRDALVAEDTRLDEWLLEFPGTDTQQLRTLVRQARKDVVATPIRGASGVDSPRHGRAYRQIFLLVRAALSHELD